jgi:hypothetical protein
VRKDVDGRRNALDAIVEQQPATEKPANVIRQRMSEIADARLAQCETTLNRKLDMFQQLEQLAEFYQMALKRESDLGIVPVNQARINVLLTHIARLYCSDDGGPSGELVAGQGGAQDAERCRRVEDGGRCARVQVLSSRMRSDSGTVRMTQTCAGGIQKSLTLWGVEPSNFFIPSPTCWQ